MKRYLYGNYIQDGMLDSSCGRIVIYNGQIEVSQGPTRDHNDILRSLAARTKMKKHDVISGAIRLYYKREDDCIIVSPVRKWDDDQFESNRKFHAMLIKMNLR